MSYLETMFLSYLYENETEIMMPTLLAKEQRDGEFVCDFIETSKNLTFRCLDDISLLILI